MKTSKNIGRPPRIPDGTEGYATISLHMVKPHPMIETIGYFVKGDSDLKSYLKDSQPCYEPEKPEDPNFVYFYLSEPDLSKTLLNVRIEAHRFYKKQKTISCCIVIKKDEAAINPVCNKKPHIFLPASPKELKKSDLWNYSKRVTSNKNLSEGNYKGVQIHVGEKVCKILKSVKFSISNNKSNNTFYINSDNDGDVFEKLRDDGPLLCDEGDGHWTVVGWYKKDSPQNRITVHHLRAQGPINIWKDKKSCPSASDQPDGLAGNGNDHEQHSDSSGHSGSSSVTVDHSAGNGSQHESSSDYMSNDYQDPTQRNQPGETSYQSLSHTTQRSTAPSSSQSGSAGLPPSQSGSAGLPPSQSESAGLPPGQSGSAGLPPSQSGSTATPTAESGLLGPSSRQSGSAGLPPSQSGSAGLPPSQSGSAGLPPSQSGSTGLPPSQSGSAGLPPNQSGSAGLPPSPSRSTATPTAEYGLSGPSSRQSGSAGLPPSQSGSAGLPPSQSGSAGLPTSQSGSTTTPTDESGLPGPPPSQSGPAVCNHLIQDILCKSESVVDILTSMLDTDYKLLQNHRHLADYLNAPPDIKQKCNCPTIHSCTLVMLELPHIQDVTVNTLREKVKAVGRNDVLNLIDKRIPSESRSKTIKEALNEEVRDEIAIKLDPPSSVIRKNWKDVGKRLKIDRDDLDQIERGESNPAKELLEHAYISVDPTLTTSGKFREIIVGFKDRTDLHNLIEEVGITQDSDLNRPLKEVIRPDSQNMKKMADYLNRSPRGLSNWKQLAFAWGLGSDQFKPQPPQSPTKSLLDWMRTEDHMTTVDQFLDILGVKMKRYDVKEALEKKIQKVPRR